MKNRMQILGDYFLIVFAAILLAASYHIFIFPNQFAPAGLPGFATMVQELFNFRVGYMTLIINVPLLIAVWLVVDRELAVKSAVFAAIFSGTLIVMDEMDISAFVYHTENGTSTILAPIAGGVISGFCYGVVMRRNSSTGGTDLVAILYHHRHPERSTVWVIFIINACVAGLSYFVYDFKLEPVILCLVYCFLSSQVSDTMLNGFKEAVKFEIITDRPAELEMVLMSALHHGITEVSAVGSYTHSEKTLLICLVNKREVVEFQRILAQYPGTFAYLSTVKETMGNFIREPLNK